MAEIAMQGVPDLQDVYDNSDGGVAILVDSIANGSNGPITISSFASTSTICLQLAQSNTDGTPAAWIGVYEDQPWLEVSDATASVSVQFYIGSGSPEGVITETLGCMYVAHDTGKWYRKAGATGTSGGWEELDVWRWLASAVPSASASVEIVGLSTLSTDYSAYLITFANLAPATDAVELWLRTSTDGGATYDAGASDYEWTNVVSTATTVSTTNDAADSELTLCAALGNAANEETNGYILIHNPSAAKHTHITGEFSIVNTAGVVRMSKAVGRRLSAANVDALQILFSSGNIASGTIKVYGLKAFVSL